MTTTAMMIMMMTANFLFFRFFRYIAPSRIVKTKQKSFEVNIFLTIPKAIIVFLGKHEPSPASFLFDFRLFKQTSQFMQQINMKNVHPVNGAGI